MAMFLFSLLGFFMANNVTIITLNCQGLRTSAPRDSLFSWLNCCKSTFVCLQETHSVSDSEFSTWISDASTSALNLSRYEFLSSPSTNRSSVVAILYQSDFHLTCSFKDQDGRLICAEFK